MIVVAGASGHLGRLVVRALKERVPASEIVAAARHPERVADLGVEVRLADYDRPETLTEALAGADRLLLISGSEVGHRVPQHGAVVEAAEQAGVDRIVYTSAPQADTTTLMVAPEHKATEALIRESGLSFTILRNNWYSENYEPTIRQAAQDGFFIGSAGDGRVASAPRADYAAAAVAVLTSDAHEGRTYELSGDVGWNYADLARDIADATGRAIEYRDLSPEEHRAALLAAGLPEEVAGVVVMLDADARNGLLAAATGDLRKLIGRPTTPMRQTVADVLSA